MAMNLILASGSEIRRQLLMNAGVPLTVQKARIDEIMIRDSLLAEEAKPRDIADALAQINFYADFSCSMFQWILHPK